MTPHKHKLSLALGAGIYVILFLILSYFFVIEPNWYPYLKKSRSYAAYQKAFLAEKKEAEESLLAQKALLSWKNKHAHFFEAQQLSQSTDYITHQIIMTAMNAHFNLIQASPIISKERLQKKILTRSFEMKITGNYLDLFSFITNLMTIHWPITLAAIKADNPHQFNLIFTIEKA